MGRIAFKKNRLRQKSEDSWLSGLTFKQISQGERELAIIKTRSGREDLEEVVVLSEDLEDWCGRFSLEFGNSISPDSMNWKKEAGRVAEMHGGIREGQQLFEKVIESHRVLVMIWPWNDKIHATFKKVLVKIPDEPRLDERISCSEVAVCNLEVATDILIINRSDFGLGCYINTRDSIDVGGKIHIEGYGEYIIRWIVSIDIGSILLGMEKV